MLNKEGASASLLDRATGEEFSRLDTGVRPHEAVVSPDGRIAVVDAHNRGSAKSSRNRVARAANRSKSGATAAVPRIRCFGLAREGFRRGGWWIPLGTPAPFRGGQTGMSETPG